MRSRTRSRRSNWDGRDGWDALLLILVCILVGWMDRISPSIHPINFPMRIVERRSNRPNRPAQSKVINRTPGATSALSRLPDADRLLP